MKKLIQILIVSGAFLVMGGSPASGKPLGGDKIRCSDFGDREELCLENLEKLKKTRACINCDFAGMRFGNFPGVDLTGANFSKAHLVYANFKGANLTNVNLKKATISSSDFEGANLTNANLTRTRITESSFKKANLTKANLSRANLYRLNLTDANMSGAILFRASLGKSSDLTGINLAGVDTKKCRCPEEFPELIAKSSNPEYIKANKERIKAENEKKLKEAKLVEQNAQKIKNKKLRRANKQLKKEFKKKIKKFLIAYKVLEDSIKKIETCCDNADDKGDPELKNYIATQKRNFTGKAESLKETYSNHITLGKDLEDSAKKEKIIQRFIEINPKIKKHNAGCSTAELGSLTEGGAEVVTYEELQECNKEVEAEVEAKFGGTPDFYRQLPMELIKECGDIKNKCVDGGIDQFDDMMLAFERNLQKIKDEARFHSSEQFNIALTKFIKDKEVRESREKRMAAAKAKIALINNTLVYKEMVAAFEKGFVSHPSNVMVMMQLKVLGKSDQEIFEYLRAGIKSYKSCVLNEVAKRFTNDQLKLMATEYGTNKLEIISLAVKCETAAAQTVKRVLQNQ